MASNFNNADQGQRLRKIQWDKYCVLTYYIITNPSILVTTVQILLLLIIVLKKNYIIIKINEMIDRYNYSYKKKFLCLTTTILHIINHLATNIRECKELYRYMYFF